MPKSDSYFVISYSNNEIQNLRKSESVRYLRKLSATKYIIAFNGVPSVPFYIKGQSKDDNSWKLPSGTNIADQKECKYVVCVLDIDAFIKANNSNDVNIINIYDDSQTIIIRIKDDKTLNQLLELSNVVFVKPYQSAKEESPNSFQDNSVNKINIVHHENPFIAGEDLTVCVKERTIDKTDIDLKNRIINSELEDSQVSLHANQIATMIAGGGNTLHTARGASWKSRVMSSSFDNLFPDNIRELQGNGVTVQNHSYGVAIENYYGPEAHAYDESINKAPEILHVFSSGNSGEEIPLTGNYAGLGRYSNITGNMKMSKNALVVGGHSRELQVDSRISRGPAYDGRIKPEVVAFGPEGSSDAAAVASGTALLLQDAYTQINEKIPSCDLVRSVMIAGADDVGAVGIDHVTGYGAINAYRSIQLIKNKWFYQDSLQDNQDKLVSLDVPAGIKSLKVTLSWIDPAATAGDVQALVNDIDLKVIDDDQNTILPWCLSSYPHIDSLSLIAKRREDHLNNNEIITIENPREGKYIIKVSSKALATSYQKYSVTFFMDSIDSFKWTYPTGSDPHPTNSEKYLRWNTTYNGIGDLAVSVNGSSYVTISNSVSLNGGFYKWLTPDSTGTAVVRMKIHDKTYYSDTFYITPPVNVSIGYNCDDEVMINWNAIEKATAYRIYTLGDLFLKPLTEVGDTSFIIKKGHLVDEYVAVEPLMDKKSGGVRSISYNVGTQGVNCYYLTFTAQAVESSALLTLNLSTSTQVQKIIWQKMVGGIYLSLDESAVVNEELLYNYTDHSITGGITDYRAIIVVKGRGEVLTNTARVYYAEKENVYLYPNPVRTTEELEILTNGDNLLLQIIDVQGRVVKRQILNTLLSKVSISDLPPGLYIYRLQRGSDFFSSGRIVIK
ncbi:S8 family peptidase [Fulvivirgaceae bacterium PWU20]|uniref:S8 family peptidase n=2 Tax=Chryseosolibacter indicus TaxID=2782351 RepID=A0ABS5VKU2_9BACT|nr:S8 family peptidase [Chryseosolibacter indicus]